MIAQGTKKIWTIIAQNSFLLKKKWIWMRIMRLDPIRDLIILKIIMLLTIESASMILLLVIAQFTGVRIVLTQKHWICLLILTCMYLLFYPNFLFVKNFEIYLLKIIVGIIYVLKFPPRKWYRKITFWLFLVHLRLRKNFIQ